MKSTNRIAVLFLFSLLTAFGIICVSCKSTPAQVELEEVDPLALLDSKSSIYVGIPVKKHLELTANVLSSQISSLSQKDSKKIASYIDVLYAGVGTLKDRSRLQFACQGEYPVNLLKKFMTSKNGWNVQNYKALSSEECLKLGYPNEFAIYSRSDSDFELSFASDKILCAAQKVDPLLEAYSIRPLAEENEITAWIQNPQEDIMFYIVRPGQYLQNLIGANLPVSCKAIYGRLIYSPDKENPDVYSKEYELNFNIVLANPKASRGVINALSLSLGMMGAKAKIAEDVSINIYNVTVTENQIAGLFTRENYKPKHFVIEDKD